MLSILGGMVLPPVLTYLLTGLTRRYALRRNILDVPNARSSHTRATPRGGGLSIVTVVLLGALLLGLLDLIPGRVAVALTGGGSLVALVGWLDDRRGLTAGARAAVHGLAALWAVAWLGGAPGLRWGAGILPLGVAGGVLAVVGIVWLINLYNFMDGIDGLAATEAVMTAGVAGGLLFASGNVPLAVATWLLGAACLGFLLWNWAPARIFMGDVGSGFLGFAFGVLALASENSGSLPALGWAILLAVFIVDATATLLRRIGNGEKWHEAHRSHAYQRAVQAGHSHERVTSCIAAINLILAVLAWIAWRWPSTLAALTFVGAGSLLLVWRYGSSLPALRPATDGE